MKISVLYVTNRPGGFDVLRGNLERQTFRDFDLVIVDGYAHREPVVPCTFTYLSDPPRRENAVTNLRAACNEGLRRCEGEYVVFLQDYIWIPASGIERFVCAQEKERGFYTGGGNIGEGPEKVDDGSFTIWGEPYYGPPERIRWEDPRIGMSNGPLRASPDAWEDNWACAPRDALMELGGYEEEYDLGGLTWGEKELASRAEALGYPIIIDTTNRCMAWWHDGFWPNPLKRAPDRNELLFRRHQAELKAGRRVLRLPMEVKDEPVRTAARTISDSRR